jgi:hypothetical protein
VGQKSFQVRLRSYDCCNAKTIRKIKGESQPVTHDCRVSIDTDYQQRIDGLTKQIEKPAVSVDQFKVIIKGMHGEPILPTDEDFAGVEEP